MYLVDFGSTNHRTLEDGMEKSCFRQFSFCNQRSSVFFYDSIDPFTGSPNRSIRVRYGSIINQVVLLWEERHDKHRATIHFSKFAGIRVSIAQRLGSSLVLCGHEWIKIKRHPGIDRNVG